jgi:hypothetical protein
MAAPIQLAKAQLGKGMTLVVVERHGSEFTAVEIKTGSDVQSYLADAWERTLIEIKAATKLAYSPEIIVRPEEGRVLEINDDLRKENEVVSLLLDPRDLARRKPTQVDVAALYLYAVVSTTKAGRLAMIKKLSPAKRAREGKAWALAQDELSLMEDDPWQLHPRFDIVVGESGAYAFSVNGFEQIFAEADRLVAKVGNWVDKISKALPMDGTQRDILIERCKESSRLRRRLRSIENRGHIGRVTVGRLRAHLKSMDIPPSRHVRQGKLVIDRTSAEELLQILNEDLFRGGLTDDAFRSEAKEPM